MIRASYVIAYLCNECGATSAAFDHQGGPLHALPVPILPDGWVERASDGGREHYCGAVCEVRAFEKRANPSAASKPLGWYAGEHSRSAPADEQNALRATLAGAAT